MYVCMYVCHAMQTTLLVMDQRQILHAHMSCRAHDRAGGGVSGGVKMF